MKLTANQNENPSHKRNRTRDEADPQSGECDDPHDDQVNREQKHSDVFGDHAGSMSNHADY